MITRFVYPFYDPFYAKHKMPECAKQLRIASEGSDGRCYFGTDVAVKNYCEDNGLKVKDVEWQVCTSFKSFSYSIIKAKNIEDWAEQFKALNVEYEVFKD